MKKLTGKTEGSFASKILSTLYPEIAPIDKLNLEALCIYHPSEVEEELKIQAWMEAHTEVNKKINQMIADKRFSILKKILLKKQNIKILLM